MNEATLIRERSGQRSLAAIALRNSLYNIIFWHICAAFIPPCPPRPGHIFGDSGLTFRFHGSEDDSFTYTSLHVFFLSLKKNEKKGIATASRTGEVGLNLYQHHREWSTVASVSWLHHDILNKISFFFLLPKQVFLCDELESSSSVCVCVLGQVSHE